MLRLLDHVEPECGPAGGGAQRGPLATPGLDLPGWLSRARERFLEAYREGLREARCGSTMTPICYAFEVDKELYEFALRGDVPAVLAVGTDRSDAWAIPDRRA